MNSKPKAKLPKSVVVAAAAEKSEVEGNNSIQIETLEIEEEKILQDQTGPFRSPLASPPPPPAHEPYPKKIKLDDLSTAGIVVDLDVIPPPPSAPQVQTDGYEVFSPSDVSNISTIKKPVFALMTRPAKKLTHKNQQQSLRLSRPASPRKHVREDFSNPPSVDTLYMRSPSPLKSPPPLRSPQPLQQASTIFSSNHSISLKSPSIERANSVFSDRLNIVDKDDATAASAVSVSVTNGKEMEEKETQSMEDIDETRSVVDSVCTTASALFQKRPRLKTVRIPRPDVLDTETFDPSKLKLKDLFYINPTKHPPPLYRREREAQRARQLLGGEEEEAASDAGGAIQKDSLSKSSSSEAVVAAVSKESSSKTRTEEPQLDFQLDEEGNIVISQECFRVNTTHDNMEMPQGDRDVEGIVTRASYNSFRKKTSEIGSRRMWSATEMVRFYQVLSTVGTDFAAIARFMPGRTRQQVHSKYKSEEKKHPHLIDLAFRNPRQYNLSLFHEVDMVYGEDHEHVNEDDDDLTRGVLNIHSNAPLVPSTASKNLPEKKKKREAAAARRLEKQRAQEIATLAMEEMDNELPDHVSTTPTTSLNNTKATLNVLIKERLPIKSSPPSVTSQQPKKEVHSIRPLRDPQLQVQAGMRPFSR